VEQLLAKLEPYMSGKDKNYVSQKADIDEKLEAPGGPVLLHHVAYIYIQEAKKNMGRFFGVEGFFASVEEKGHNFKQLITLVRSAVKLQVAQDRMEQVGEDEELAAEVMSQGLSTIWKMGKMEIESMIRDVCSAIFKVQDKNLKKKRATALKDLGEFYRDEAKKAKKRLAEVMSDPEMFFRPPDDSQKSKSSSTASTSSTSSTAPTNTSAPAPTTTTTSNTTSSTSNMSNSSKGGGKTPRSD